MMTTNCELKAVVTNRASLESALANLNLPATEIHQRDEYLVSNDEYLKLRFNNGAPHALIRYSRSITPKSRISEYTKVPIERSDLLHALAVAPRAGVIEKRRLQFRSDHFLINYDDVVGFGSVVEIECFAPDGRVAEQQLSTLKTALRIENYSIIPYSNIHLVNMAERARIFREHVGKHPGAGSILFVDGPSASGKSTLQEALMRTGKFKYVKRDTTRPPRNDDSVTMDYVFVSQRDFFHRALVGGYIECRDYEFGMSYGLPWEPVETALVDGRNVIGLINLGNGFLLKRLLPECRTVLLLASISTIKERLERRGTLKPEQIEERLSNARSARDYESAYDLCLDTGVTPTDAAVEKILATL